MSKILITNGGPHSAEKWAVATAEHIFPINDAMVGERLLAAKRFQLGLTELLMPHHGGMQTAERDALKAKGDAQLSAPIDPLARAQAAMEKVVAYSKGTPWEGHFARAEVQAVLVQEIGNHFATAAHIERLWHCNRNPNSETARAWLADHHQPVEA